MTIEIIKDWYDDVVRLRVNEIEVSRIYNENVQWTCDEIEKLVRAIAPKDVKIEIKEFQR